MEDTLTVEYASLRREVWRSYWYLWRHSNQVKAVHALVALFAFCLVLGVRSRSGVPAPSDFAVALLVAVAAVAWMPLFPLLRFKPAKRVLRLDAEGFTTQIGRLSGARKWREIGRVERLASGEVLIVNKTGNTIIVPRRAFASDDAAARFYEQVRAWHASVAQAGGGNR